MVSLKVMEAQGQLMLEIVYRHLVSILLEDSSKTITLLILLLQQEDCYMQANNSTIYISKNNRYQVPTSKVSSNT